MKTLAHYDSAELRLLYRVLHTQLMDHVELMDSALLDDLQTWLQTLARRDGVDVSNHREWDQWLDNTGTASRRQAPGRPQLSVLG
jgi:hypothetical protein